MKKCLEERNDIMVEGLGRWKLEKVGGESMMMLMVIRGFPSHWPCPWHSMFDDQSSSFERMLGDLRRHPIAPSKRSCNDDIGCFFTFYSSSALEVKKMVKGLNA